MRAKTWIALPASQNSRMQTFQVARVDKILHKKGTPCKINITWYDTNAKDPYKGKYTLEVKASENTSAQEEVLTRNLDLLKTKIFAYDFVLMESECLPLAIIRSIKRALGSFVESPDAQKDSSNKCLSNSSDSELEDLDDQIRICNYLCLSSFYIRILVFVTTFLLSSSTKIVIDRSL